MSKVTREIHGFASILLIAVTYSMAVAQSADGNGRVIENEFLKVKVLPDWTIEKSSVPTVVFARAKFRLKIDPLYEHASGIIGGRFPEYTQGMKSVDAVMAEVDQPAGGFECAAFPADAIFVTDQISLSNLYSDRSKVDYGCHFPDSGKSVWFGSFCVGSGPATEYTITMYYDTSDVNELPVKGDPGLQHTFREVAEVLKTLEWKTPVVISRVDPESAASGQIVTVYGHWFRLLDGTAGLRIQEEPEIFWEDPLVDAEGESLRFEVPTSINVASCQEGRVDIGGFCLPTPPGHVDTDNCPRTGRPVGNLCGKPIPPGAYHLSVVLGEISTDSLPFTILPPKPTPVSLSLIYPNMTVRAGDTITVRGTGFTTTSNIFHLDSVTIADISSSDGNSITFKAPRPEGTTLAQKIKVHNVWVSNANGESNRLTFAYRGW